MSQPVVGKPYDRVDGRLKVTGGARYTPDVSVASLTHAVIVPSTIANGRIVSIDESAARKAPGVLEVMTHRNAPRVTAKKNGPEDSLLFLLQDEGVEFDRQPVAVVVAETFEQATHAASLLRIRYDAQAPLTELASGKPFVPKEIFGDPATHQRGTPLAALDAAPHRIEQTYTTPTEHHNPMETHGTLAHWDGKKLMVHDSTQWPFGVKRRLAAIFGISADDITVSAPFVGGAFGGKGTTWSHVPLAAMAAKMVKRPVKLIVTRPQMFGWVGHRPQTVQTVALGADNDGKLLAVRHTAINETSMSDEFVEPSTVFSRDLYAVPNFAMSQELRRLHISKPTYQRGPGESTGGFAMESAMDELAHELKIDPLELRLRNYSENDPDSGKPYSSKKLRECYQAAADRFGWSRRNPVPRAVTQDGMLVGLGMSTASRSVHRSEAAGRIHMNADGTIVIQSSTIEQGTGSSTVYGQLASEILGVPFERVRFEFGNTTLPFAPIAAGSQTSGTIGSVVVAAANALRERLDSLGGKVPAQGITIDVQAKPPQSEEFATQAFGANFAEVHVDPDLGTVRVARFVGAFDGGRILNEKTATSQFLGGVVWGISMALYEISRYDKRIGRIMNATLSEYLIPTNADIPNVELIIVPNDDANINPAGAKGIGEVGICGSSAAVANAIFNATAIRIRDLPITPDKLLQ